jgi:hypothetical protein
MIAPFKAEREGREFNLRTCPDTTQVLMVGNRMAQNGAGCFSDDALTCIWKAPTFNLACITGHPDRIFFVIILGVSNEYKDSTLH